MEGWFKFKREWLENRVITADGDHLRVWIFLLAQAAFEPRQAVFRGEAITLEVGQLLTGRKKLAALSGVQEDKVQRVLKRFQNAQLILQESSATCRKITIVELYETATELHSACTADAQPLHSTCTTDAQRMHTYKELKNEKNERAKTMRAQARNAKRKDAQIFSSDASYDLEAYMRHAIGLQD